MQRGLSIRLVVAVLALLGSVACTDKNEVLAPAIGGAAQRAALVPTSNQPGVFPCVTTLDAAGGTAILRETITYPRKALSPLSRVTTVEFQVRNEKTQGQVGHMMCALPNTDAAFTILERKMGIELSHPGDDSSVTMMSTSSDACTWMAGGTSGYYCDWGVVGVGQTSNGCSETAFDPSWTCTDPYYYCQFNAYSYGCPQSPCYLNNTMDLCSDPCYIYNNCTVIATYLTPNPWADDQNTTCHLGNSGNCNMQVATSAERAKARTLMNNVRQEEICGQARSLVLDVVNDTVNAEHMTRFQVWTNTVTQDGKVIIGDYGWFYVNPTGTEKVPTIHVMDSYDGFSAWTLVHEALHGLSYDHEDFISNPDGVARSMDQTAKYCARA